MPTVSWVVHRSLAINRFKFNWTFRCEPAFHTRHILSYNMVCLSKTCSVNTTVFWLIHMQDLVRYANLVSIYAWCSSYSLVVITCSSWILFQYMCDSKGFGKCMTNHDWTGWKSKRREEIEGFSLGQGNENNWKEAGKFQARKLWRCKVVDCNFLLP